jgi:hypothetical protein
MALACSLLMRAIESSKNNCDLTPIKEAQSLTQISAVSNDSLAVEEAEARIAAIDAEMFANGSDVGKLTDLAAKREAQENKVSELMEEWEKLEQLLATLV